jgi:glycosyltransferase involved in cell wall biosynthesis
VSVKISAYIPVYNNASTLAAALESLRSQTHPIDEILVIDDGSRDDSASIATRMKARLIRLERNLGRGAARARAMLEAQNELVLCCDGTNTLAKDFTERALSHFQNSRVAAVFGRLIQPPPRNCVERWRGRHLFRVGDTPRLKHEASLITFGTIMRRGVVLEVGNYDTLLRHSEDRELGARLLKAGLDVVHDPSLMIVSQARNTLTQVLERYWRWHAGYEGKPQSVRDYLRQIGYSIRVMARLDLVQGDPLSVPISLACPHLQFLTSHLRPNHAKADVPLGTKVSADGKVAESTV